MTTPEPFDVEACRRHCKCSILNTPTGNWLRRACEEIERLRAELRQEAIEAGKVEYCLQAAAKLMGVAPMDVVTTVAALLTGSRPRTKAADDERAKLDREAAEQRIAVSRSRSLLIAAADDWYPTPEQAAKIDDTLARADHLKSTGEAATS